MTIRIIERPLPPWDLRPGETVLHSRYVHNRDGSVIERAWVTDDAEVAAEMARCSALFDIDPC